MKRVLTTGEVARICQMGQATAIRLFDQGLIEGYRLPGSGDRRIPYRSLLKFMRENNIPLDLLKGDKPRVLIVDDEPGIVDSLTEAFTREGYEVSSASDGFQAGLAAKEVQPDLIVLDYKLPDMDGKRVCELLRNDPDLKDVKIIAITAYLSDRELAGLKEQGFDDAVAKPFSLADFCQRVRELLQ